MFPWLNVCSSHFLNTLLVWRPVVVKSKRLTLKALHWNRCFLLLHLFIPVSPSYSILLYQHVQNQRREFKTCQTILPKSSSSFRVSPEDQGKEVQMRETVKLKLELIKLVLLVKNRAKITRSGCIKSFSCSSLFLYSSFSFTSSLSALKHPQADRCLILNLDPVCVCESCIWWWYDISKSLTCVSTALEDLAPSGKVIHTWTPGFCI